ncbi:MAG: ATP-binding protein [Bacteroidota bacterium]
MKNKEKKNTSILESQEVVSQILTEHQDMTDEIIEAKKELAFENIEKEKRASELIVAKKEKKQRAKELIIANKELVYQNEQKEKRASELIIANKELAYQNQEKEKRASELIIANKALAYQNQEKEKRANELIIANKELAYQNQEKEKRANELIIANKELAYQNQEKEKRANELIIANKELAYQNQEKEKRANELIIANKELAYQNQEKEKRAAELVLAKEIAEEYESKFRQIAENVDEVFWLRSRSEMIYVSPSFEKIWGVPVQEIYKDFQVFTEIIHPDDRPAVQEILQSKEFLDETLFNYEFRIIQPDHQIRWVNSKTFPILDESGTIIKRAGIAKDITEKYQNIQELVSAMEKAEKSDRLKSAFLANMSHEIRTPMNGILGFSELLKEPNLSGDQQQEYIEIIEKSGLRMLNIINNIVDISKIEADLMTVNITESNVGELAKYIYTFFKPQAEDRHIELLNKNAIDDIEILIETDREKVYAILSNLVKNAIKFTDAGSVEFGFVLNADKTPVEIEFSVKDTGIGIPKNRLEDIFERFIQADIEDRMARQGSGLGLTISKSYVEMLGGRIWAESEEGIGSTFYFTLPCMQTHQEADTLPIVEPEKMAIESKMKNIKILVAEDDEQSAALLGILLKALTENLFFAKNGAEAVEICRNNPEIDLILMDIKMPVMGGYSATRSIREFNKDVKIIAQTAFGLSEDRQKAFEAGCNDYLSKPIKKSILYEMINRYIPNA